MLSPVETEAVIGEVEVRALFRVSRLGTIAGCMVTSGVVRRGARVRIFRDGARIHETTIAQLKRFKDDAREVAEGFECGILLDGLQRPARGRHLRGLRDARGRADVARRAARATPAAAADAPAAPMRGGFVAILVGRAALPRGRLAEGQAQVRAVGEGAARRTASARRWPRSTTTSSGSAAR